MEANLEDDIPPMPDDPRPPGVPESYVRAYNPETGLWGWIPVPRKRRSIKGEVKPAAPELLRAIAMDYGVPVPAMFIGTERKMAREHGDKLYWGNDGCHKHGYPMLRHTKAGTCVLCDKYVNERKKAQRRAGKYTTRRYMDDVPQSRELAVQYKRPTFWTGKPCIHGHVAERRTKGGACLQCVCQREGRAYAPPLPGRRPGNQVHPALRYEEPPTIAPRAPKPQFIPSPAQPVPSKPLNTKLPEPVDELDAILMGLTGTASPKK